MTSRHRRFRLCGGSCALGCGPWIPCALWGMRGLWVPAQGGTGRRRPGGARRSDGPSHTRMPLRRCWAIGGPRPSPLPVPAPRLPWPARQGRTQRTRGEAAARRGPCRGSWPLPPIVRHPVRAPPAPVRAGHAGGKAHASPMRLRAAVPAAWPPPTGYRYFRILTSFSCSSNSDPFSMSDLEIFHPNDLPNRTISSRDSDLPMVFCVSRM